MPADQTPPPSPANFVEALAFCLAYEQAGGAAPTLNQSAGCRAAAQWALAQGPDIPDNEKAQTVALVSGGATKIKGYVFESARLPEIRGASSLLDRINLSTLPALWKDLGCPLSSEPPQLPLCVIYANGGELLAFAPPSRALALADAIERAYTEETLTAQSVAVTRTFTLAQLREGLGTGQGISSSAAQTLLGYDPTARGLSRTFGSLVAPLALAKYRRREGNDEAARGARTLPYFETMPFARRCASCDRRMAVTFMDAGENRRFLCEPCDRKRTAGAKKEKPHGSNPQTWTGKFEAWLGHQPNGSDYFGAWAVDEVEAPEDLSDIAQAAYPEGFIGVVYADGNNMGALLEELGSPAQYAAFAGNVFDATQEAVFSALQNNLKPVQAKDGRGRERPIHPFEILSIGGDDLFLLVPAQAALPIACDIAEKMEEVLLTRDTGQFEARLDNGTAASYSWDSVQRCRDENGAAARGIVARQCTVSMSVGVVLAPQQTPVFYLQEFAGALLKSAKTRAKALKKDSGYFGGTVDFQSLKSNAMLGDTIKSFRDAALTTAHGRLYARPYTIAETRVLLQTIAMLKDTGFPRSQVYRLRESLRKGQARSTVDYLYFLSRSDETRHTREAIERLWQPSEALLPHPWRDDPAGSRETIWTDLVELYDFVPALEE